MTIFTEFDETDDILMAELSEEMALLVPSVFPSTIEINGKTHNLRYSSVLRMEEKQIQSFCSIVDECLGPLYIKHKGLEWKEEKIDEMAGPGLIYVWYESEHDISCFLSMRMVLEPVGKTLYLYEIHVKPVFQENGIGTKFIDFFHEYGRYINSLSGQPGSDSKTFFACVATGLTVFSDNSNALKWYSKLGYSFAPDSPLDKSFRNGRVVKPSFYILSRRMNSI